MRLFNNNQLWKNTPDDATPNNVTMTWYPSDSLANYKAEGNAYTIDSFDYKFNEYGFRCESFTNVDDAPFRVLFAGCSITVGIGLPLNHTWAYMVKERLEQEFSLTIPYWNIAKGGQSSDFNARTLYKVLPILKPHLVLFLVPPGARFEMFVEDKGYNYLQGHSQDVVGINQKELIKTFSDAAQHYNLAKNLIMMKAMCAEYGSKFLWNGAYAPSASNENDLLNNFDSNLAGVHFNGKFKESKIRARDSLHPGFASHQSFVETAMPEILEKIKLV